MDILEVVPQGRLHGIELGCDVEKKKGQQGARNNSFKIFCLNLLISSLISIWLNP